MMKYQAEYVITIKEEHYDSAPAQIFGASGIYAFLVCVAVGFWFYHDSNEKTPTFFNGRRASIAEAELSEHLLAEDPISTKSSE